MWCLMTNQQDVIEQSMQAQQVYLDIVRRRHLLWASSSSDSEIRRRHLAIAEMIQESMDRYYELLSTYQERSVGAERVRPDVFTLHAPSLFSSDV